ncbi:MAG TPA: hypothetical protein VM490_07610, partial [Armatimonadaceae bacterium]|nr:hypothetical protein [Armatimonadaceae bacterium]
NARLVQGIFDDRNPETRRMWDYPDGTPFDAERNTREFVAQMPAWREAGLLSFTINLQGGSPQGYSKEQPWHNSAFEADGSLRGDYLARLEAILDRADELGMAPIVGYFYFGQDHRLKDEAAVLRAVDAATDWLLAKGYANVLVEIANECDIRYTHPLILAPRNHELIRRVRERSAGKVKSPAGRLLVGTSMSGGALPTEAIVAESDFLLLHGNGVHARDKLRDLIDRARKMTTFRGQPVVVNEDDHFDFDKPDNNFLAALDRYASWGYFDFRMKDEGFAEGYQSVPTDWGTNSARKKGFFKLLRAITRGEEQ